MDMHPDTPPVQINDAAQRFEAHVAGQSAFINYYRSGDSLVLVHTEVPSELEGQGLGARLAEVALGYAQDHQLRIVPKCQFIAAYIRKHPQYQALLAKQ